MGVGERDVARCFHQQVQTIVFRDASFVTLDNAGNLFRKLGLLRPRLEFIGVAQLVIGDTDDRDSHTRSANATRRVMTGTLPRKPRAIARLRVTSCISSYPQITQIFL